MKEIPLYIGEIMGVIFIIAGEETGGEVLILIIAVPDGNSRKNGQVSHALNAESIHAVGAVSGTCCRGWLDI
jgi:hypothetical protein